jgi:hypothetical protein
MLRTLLTVAMLVSAVGQDCSPYPPCSTACPQSKVKDPATEQTTCCGYHVADCDPVRAVMNNQTMPHSCDSSCTSMSPGWACSQGWRCLPMLQHCLPPEQGKRSSNRTADMLRLPRIRLRFSMLRCIFDSGQSAALLVGASPLISASC